MGLDVFRQVIGAHELLGALRTLEALLAGVGSAVSLQLVGPRELLAAEYPTAYERSLARVPSQVSPQVARLPIHLVAPGDVTDVLPLARHIPVAAVINKNIHC